MKESWANEDILSETPHHHSSSRVVLPDMAYLDDLKLPSMGRIGSDPMFRSCGLQDRLNRYVPALRR